MGGKIGTFTKIDFSRFHLCKLFHHFLEIEILSDANLMESVTTAADLV
jgi:hypothetical protein